MGPGFALRSSRSVAGRCTLRETPSRHILLKSESSWRSSHGAGTLLLVSFVPASLSRDGRGCDTGTGFAAPLAFQTDMGFMQGEFIGEDGEHHNRTFVFI